MTNKSKIRILGLDVGSKKIGVAVSDELGITAQGLKTIARKSNENVIDQIKKIISEFNIKELIIGLPLNMNGTRGEGTQQVIEFVDKVKEEIDIPIKMWDERLTTMEIERLLVDSDVSRKKRKDVKDKLAAQLILQNYLTFREKKDV